MAEKFSVALTNDLNEVSGALPKEFNKQRFVQNAVALLNSNKSLQEYAKEYGSDQIKVGMMKAAYLGLDFLNKEAYLIPYKNQLNFMIDYRGNVKLCKKYSIRKIKDIYAKIVREGDQLEETIVDGHPSITFRPIAFNNAEIIGAFAVCLFEDGGMICESMSLEELENTRKSSKAANSPAWTNFTGEMYKKTVLHRICKHIELDFDSFNQREFFEEDMQLANVEEQVENDIEANANNTLFPDSDVIDID